MLFLYIQGRYAVCFDARVATACAAYAGVPFFKFLRPNSRFDLPWQPLNEFADANLKNLGRLNVSFTKQDWKRGGNVERSAHVQDATRYNYRTMTRRQAINKLIDRDAQLASTKEKLRKSDLRSSSSYRRP